MVEVRSSSARSQRVEDQQAHAALDPFESQSRASAAFHSACSADFGTVMSLCGGCVGVG